MTALLRGRARDRTRIGPRIDPADRVGVAVGVAAIAVVLGVVAVMLDTSALDVWTGLIVFLVLVTAAVPALNWVARKEGDPWLFPVLFGALVLHLLFALVRYFFIFGVYGGSADAGRYHEAGVVFANRLRDGQPLHPIEIVQGFPVESQRIGDIVGGLYTVTGPSAYAGFFVFAFACFWGQVLMLRAFRRAVPEGDHRRYTLLVMFLPSLLFWPSSIGKEALMITCLGVIIYGGSLLLGQRPQLRGAVFFVLGVGLVLLVRPHVALMSVGALVIAMTVGVLGNPATEARLGSRGRAIRLVGLAVLVLLAVVAVARSGEALSDRGEEATATAALEKALNQSSTGGSEFAPAAVTGPAQLPAGVVSVLFRPFPWEAGNVNSLIAGAESLVLVVLVALSWRRLLSLPVMLLRRPFLVFSLSYLIAFVIGFSFIANFGILARQRVQVLPIFLMFLALPTLAELRGGRVRDSSGQDLAVPDAPALDAGNVEDRVGPPRTGEVPVPS